MNYYNESIIINEDYLKGIAAVELCEINLSSCTNVQMSLTNNGYCWEFWIETHKYSVSIIVTSIMTHDQFLKKLRNQLLLLEPNLSHDNN